MVCKTEYTLPSGGVLNNSIYWTPPTDQSLRIEWAARVENYWIGLSLRTLLDSGPMILAHFCCFPKCSRYMEYFSMCTVLVSCNSSSHQIYPHWLHSAPFLRLLIKTNKCRSSSVLERLDPNRATPILKTCGPHLPFAILNYTSSGFTSLDVVCNRFGIIQLPVKKKKSSISGQ